MTHQKLDEKTQGEIIGEAVAVSYLEQINRLQSELAELKAENETLKRAVSIAERRNGDTSDLMDASQEAQHYDWLDEQNAKLKEELLAAREVIKTLKSEFRDIQDWMRERPSSALAIKSVDMIIDSIELHEKKFGVGND